MRRLTVALGLLVLLGTASLAPAALAGKAGEGWGRDATFIGRYHMKVLAPGPAGVRGGRLTMFIQEEFPGSEAPAGILTLRTKTNNAVVYLTDLRHRGRTRTATVKGGAFVGPTIGRFEATMKRPGILAGTVTARGFGHVKAVFTRFSRRPTP